MKCTINGCENTATHQEVLDKTFPTGEYNCAEHLNPKHSDPRYSLEQLDPTMGDLYTCAIVWGDAAHIKDYRFAEYKVTLERMDRLAGQRGVIAVVAERHQTWVNVVVCYTSHFDPVVVWTIFQ